METIAKYELREVLGRGGMGVVYRAYDPLMDREVALKIIQEKALDVPELKARFVREARMAGRLSHDNIAVVHDLGEAQGKTYIVMEYLPGRNLRSIIEAREDLPLQVKLDFAAQICRGLHFAHANGIIHRDVKPENIQVLPSRRIKIMDFGIAKPQMQGNIPAGSLSQLTLTSAGMRIGTPSYMSPEQVKGHPVDLRSDIFSLGVLLYELFTYEKPFRGEDTTVLYKIVHEDPEPLRLDDSRLTELLQRVIGKCLAKEPAARYDDCIQVLRDLQEARPRSNEGQTSAAPIDAEFAGAATLKMLPGSFVGQTISHFRILEKIGDGGMGTVYKAEDLTLKRTVALKFLLSEGTLNPRAKERFLMEAQAASALDHPNICTIYEIGETGGGLFFICMSFCAGEDLGKTLQKRNLDVAEALEISIKVARGLARAHQHGIVHRDIKPANVIVGPSGEVKVVDFGLAKLSGSTQFTRMASVMGTLPYMSPEQIKGGEIDHRTDVWSLGVVLYQALTGKLPFEGAYEAALFYAIVNEAPVPPSAVRPSLPPLLDAIVAKALAKKPNDRYSEMDEFMKDMARVREEHSTREQLDLGGSPEISTLLENGKAYLERRKFSEALSRFEAALTLAPGHPEAESLRIRSVQELAQARELEALVQQADELLKRGKTAEAREILLGVAARDPQNRQAVTLLESAQKTLEREERLAKLLLEADFYVRRGKPSEARECYQKVLELRPDHKEALRGLKRTERLKEQETNRVMRKTPVPVSTRPARRFLVPSVLLGLVILAGLAWFLLQTSGREGASSSTASNTPAATTAKPETQIQSGMNKPPNSHVAEVPGTKAESTLQELKDRVARTRAEMLAEKRRVEKTGAHATRSEAYRSALRQERDANRIADAGTEEGLRTASSGYAAARDSYRDAADAKTTVAQTGNGEASAVQPPAAPDRLPANTPEKAATTVTEQPSQKAKQTTSGERSDRSPVTPAKPPATETQQPPAVEKNPKQTPQDALASNTMSLEAAARNDIGRLLQDYRESIERGDVKKLGHLLNLTDEATGSWSLFFSSSENRKVSIEGVNMDVNGNIARVAFKARMSFFNNQTNSPQSNENPRVWTLELENGIWKIVTQK